MTRIPAVALVAVLTIGLAGCPAAIPLLSAAAEVACAGQKAANAATEAARKLGKTEAAEWSSKVSTALGFACLW